VRAGEGLRIALKPSPDALGASTSPRKQGEVRTAFVAIDFQPLWDWFRALNESTGIKLTIFYDAFDRARFFNGFLTSVRLMAICLVASVIIGVVGAWIQGSRLRVLRLITQGYIQFFRNTPPLVQLYFFYFALGSYLKVTTSTGIAVPIVSNFAWAAICLSFYAGAFNVEIFRAGIEAVPRETLEAAESLGYSRLKAYAYVILPLAFRISLPALNNNLVNLIKTTTIAYAIAVPEMLYVANQIWSDESNVPEMMNVLLVIYVALVGVLVWVMGRWERALTIPGYSPV
jgi:polar amino acid transport system permease protein